MFSEMHGQENEPVRFIESPGTGSKNCCFYWIKGRAGRIETTVTQLSSAQHVDVANSTYALNKLLDETDAGLSIGNSGKRPDALAVFLQLTCQPCSKSAFASPQVDTPADTARTHSPMARITLVVTPKLL